MKGQGASCKWACLIEVHVTPEAKKDFLPPFLLFIKEVMLWAAAAAAASEFALVVRSAVAAHSQGSLKIKNGCLVSP